MKSKFDVKFPTQAEIDQQIAKIVEKGLPRKQSFFETLFSIYRDFPKRLVFFDRGEWQFSLFLLAIITVQLIYTIREQTHIDSAWNAYLFLISPLLFLALTGFSTIQKKFAGTLELEMTMKYTLYHLLAIRMLYYSVFASMVHISCVVLLAQFFAIDLIKVISVALAGLFLFASGLLYIVRRGRGLVHVVLYCSVWFGGNIVLFSNEKILYMSFIQQLPNVLFIAITLLTLTLFLMNIYQLFTKKQGGSFECFQSKI